MNDIFSIDDFRMPEGFLWGSATAGHQIEGDNVNSNLYFEELEKIKVQPAYELSGKACNSYEMWQEDVELLSKLKHNTYRMTIEWSRIEPDDDF